MSQQHPESSSWTARTSDGLVMALLVAAGCATHFLYGSEQYYGENALFESGQNLTLFGAVVAFYIAATRSGERACKSVMWGLTLTCMAMLLREIDVRGTDLEPHLSAVFEQRIPYGILLVFGAALLWSVAMDVNQTLRRSAQWLFSLPGTWFVTGVILYLIGDASEKNFFTDRDHLAQMTEESAELLGALCIFCAGYITLRRQFVPTSPRRTLSPGDER